MTEELILVRHGESVFTAEAVLNGDPAIEGPLTERGRAQAKRVADELATERIDLCISSSFPRTRETAWILVDGRDVPYEVMPRLNDPPVGRFEGEPFAEYFDWVHARAWTDTQDGCESQLQSVRRYLEAYADIVRRPAGLVLVVAHAFVTSFALTVADPGGPALRLRYEKEVELAQPYRVPGDRLREGLDRARRELAEIERRL